VAIVNVLQLEAARAAPALSRFPGVIAISVFHLMTLNMF